MPACQENNLFFKATCLNICGVFATCVWNHGLRTTLVPYTDANAKNNMPKTKCTNSQRVSLWPRFQVSECGSLEIHLDPPKCAECSPEVPCPFPFVALVTGTHRWSQGHLSSTGNIEQQETHSGARTENEWFYQFLPYTKDDDHDADFLRQRWSYEICPTIRGSIRSCHLLSFRYGGFAEENSAWCTMLHCYFVPSFCTAPIHLQTLRHLFDLSNQLLSTYIDSSSRRKHTSHVESNESFFQSPYQATSSASFPRSVSIAKACCHWAIRAMALITQL